MSRTILDIHILQVVPPSNINRDDTGTPKTANFGGVRRARVSSQAWKRATRKEFEGLVPDMDLGVRTKRVVQAVADRIAELDESAKGTAVELAAEVFQHALGKKLETPKRKNKDQEPRSEVPESAYLLFLSARQIEALARIALSGEPGGDVKALKTHFKEKKNKDAAKAAINTRHSVDIALFGRMVADAADLNVDASVQVAHALGIHRSDIESDYFTAVDDRNEDEESGAGMIGVVDFNSATLYRYAAVDVDALHRNLGVGFPAKEDANKQDRAIPAAQAARAFLDAFVHSLPTGKINTFGNHTLPSAVLVKIRDRRPISFVGAFERPVTQAVNGGFLKAGCEALAQFVPDIESQYGLTRDTPPRSKESASEDEPTLEPTSWIFRIGEDTDSLEELGDRLKLPELLEAVESALSRRLGSST
ncbi:type I-E CRISPR-associated protein Cas7/Cse4/CasC [Streptomyces sp. BI20]|uniref:type I-E CRISPR-associated protein Cas7/Cse4/CasC n=1 Tax=Streptomyces sp. BI20 TaxID=3403460 RepID=UPI003C71CC07